jgi:hypothetical protein
LRAFDRATSDASSFPRLLFPVRRPGRRADRQRLLGAVLPGARHPARWPGVCALLHFGVFQAPGPAPSCRARARLPPRRRVGKRCACGNATHAPRRRSGTHTRALLGAPLPSPKPAVVALDVDRRVSSAAARRCRATRRSAAAMTPSTPSSRRPALASTCRAPCSSTWRCARGRAPPLGLTFLP